MISHTVCISKYATKVLVLFETIAQKDYLCAKLDRMVKLIKTDDEYKLWIADLKNRIQQSQIKAAVKVNSEMLYLYWSLGQDIVIKKAQSHWGDGILTQLSSDLSQSFPNVKGFSKRNLELITKWYLFYSRENTIAKQVVSQSTEILFCVPWGHHIRIIQKCETIQEALFYLQQTVEHGWSRNMLLNFMDTNLYKRDGKAITNFQLRLPGIQSDLAQQITKDPYNFDFLTLHKDYVEKELEDALIYNISRFLLELGSGFAYMGRQIPVIVDNREFRIDMLFYNVRIKAYVVVELKTGEFEPEYISKLSFYVSAINHQMKTPEDNPTIGLLICKSKSEIIARYTLEATTQPIGISEYELTELYPKEFQSSLPTIEEIEKELKK